MSACKAGMVHSVSRWTRGVQVKLWDPLRTRAIPERLRGVFTTRRYTNTRLPLPLPLPCVWACELAITAEQEQIAVVMNCDFFCLVTNRKKISSFSRSRDWRHAHNYVAKRYMAAGVSREVYFEDVRLQMDAKLWGEEFNRHNPPKKVQTYIVYFLVYDGCPLVAIFWIKVSMLVTDCFWLIVCWCHSANWICQWLLILHFETQIV